MRAFNPRSLTVFNFHRIRAESAFSTEFDEDVFGPTADEFRSHMRWLKANSELLSEDDLLASALRSRSRQLPGPRAPW